MLFIIERSLFERIMKYSVYVVIDIFKYNSVEEIIAIMLKILFQFQFFRIAKITSAFINVYRNFSSRPTVWIFRVAS